MPIPRSQNRRGVTMIESALTLSLLLFVLIGIVDIGTVLFTYQGLVQRAHAGARYAIVNTYDEEKIKNVVVYGSPNGGSSAILALSTEMVEVVSDDVDNQTSRVVVTIGNYPVRLFTPYVAGSFNLPPIKAVLTTESAGATT